MPKNNTQVNINCLKLACQYDCDNETVSNIKLFPLPNFFMIFSKETCLHYSF